VSQAPWIAQKADSTPEAEPSGLRAALRAQVGKLAIAAELDTGAGTLVLVGPNGAGKSTMLSLLLGIALATSGRITVGGQVLLDTENGTDVPTEQRRLGYVPQHYALFPHLSVQENVEFAIASSAGRLPRAARRERALKILEELDLGALAPRAPSTLSGGEKQRVALARALSVKPQALLLDEPLAALDIHSRRAVRQFLTEYLHGLDLPAIVVTHDAADARQLGQRIAVLEQGKITQSGTWEELEKAPASPFVQEFVAS
jgi:molybdate transport system ATP-binding protein